jgi:hypothetical protein
LVVGIGLWCKTPGFRLTGWKQMEKKLRTWQRFGYLFTCLSAILYSNLRLAKQWNPRLLAILWYTCLSELGDLEETDVELISDVVL